jgi:hypothetical protein
MTVPHAMTSLHRTLAFRRFSPLAIILLVFRRPTTAVPQSVLVTTLISRLVFFGLARGCIQQWFAISWSMVFQFRSISSTWVTFLLFYV